MTSLKELVEKHGLGIWVETKDKRYPRFQILKDDGKFYEVQYESGRLGVVLKEYKTCNDYFRMTGL